VNVDATAMSQAFMGAGYIGRIFQRELLTYSGQAAASQAPALLTTRALFNTNLEGGWFLAVIQIVNNITILAIVLTGTALLREREHGTLDHLLVLPLTALEIMLAKIWSNMLVVVLCTWVSLEVVVKGVMQGSPSTHFVSLSAAILFRDAGVNVVWPELLGLAGIGLLFFAVALMRFRKTLTS